MAATPDLILLGQVGIDDIVPASPGPWRREIGGGVLYAAAGARLWLEPERIGIVTRVGRDFPFALDRLLAEAGIGHVVARPVDHEHLVEWFIYEPDGSRRCLPRNRALLGIGAEGATATDTFLAFRLPTSPSAEDIPEDWLPAAAMHLCPQMGARHPDSLRALKRNIGWISVDPSPHYSRLLDAPALAHLLTGCSAFLPSTQEVAALLQQSEPHAAVLDLHRAGLPEVVLKRGADPAIVAAAGEVAEIPVSPAVLVDPTGAGDSFCGAYAACRLLGFSPVEAARRATATAARIVGSSGAAAALSLAPGL
jgi:ribokinase